MIRLSRKDDNCLAFFMDSENLFVTFVLYFDTNVTSNLKIRFGNVFTCVALFISELSAMIYWFFLGFSLFRILFSFPEILTFQQKFYFEVYGQTTSTIVCLKQFFFYQTWSNCSYYLLKRLFSIEAQIAKKELHFIFPWDASDAMRLLRVARWPFFGPFLTNVVIYESHFLEIFYLAINRVYGYFLMS